MESEISRTRFVERVFRLRALGLGLGFFAVAGVLLDHGARPWVWTLLAIDAFLWPHLARQFALHGSDPERAEINNLLIDSAMGGVWIALMQFSIVPSALLVVMLAVDKISVGGWRLLGHAFALQVAACAMTAAANDFAFEPESSIRSILMSLPFLAGYPVAIAAATFALARRASRHNRMLARQTRVDASTGLLNRPSWEAAVDSELRRFKRGGAAAALLMIDIDHFKAFNDRFGHAAGDKALKRVALEIMAAARVSDHTYRFGGEEFVVIADGCKAEDALALGERIRRRAAGGFATADAEAQLTVSIGIATCSRDAKDYDTLFEVADKRLYQAKADGRDRVVGGDTSFRLVQAG